MKLSILFFTLMSLVNGFSSGSSPSCSCAASYTTYDTLSPGVVEESYYFGVPENMPLNEIVSVDTHYVEEFWNNLNTRFDTSTYVFKATVDSVYREDVENNGVIIIGAMEQILIRVESVFKGPLEEGESFWLARHGFMSSCDYGFSSTVGRSFLSYSMKLDSIIDFNIIPVRGCTFSVTGILETNGSVEFHQFPGLSLSVAQATGTPLSVLPAVFGGEAAAGAFYIGPGQKLNIPVSPGTASEIFIYNVSGDVVKHIGLSGKGNLDTRSLGLPDGVYFIKP